MSVIARIAANRYGGEFLIFFFHRARDRQARARLRSLARSRRSRTRRIARRVVNPVGTRR